MANLLLILLNPGLYSMALTKCDPHLFYFDSHSRSLQGYKSRARDEQALILKLSPCRASCDHIGKIVNKNCCPSQMTTYDSVLVTITPLLLTFTDPEQFPHIEANYLITSPPSPPPIVSTFGGEVHDDCLIHPIDFIEPRVTYVLHI